MGSSQIETPPNPIAQDAAPQIEYDLDCWNQSSAKIPKGTVVVLDVTNDAANMRSVVAGSTVKGQNWYGIAGEDIAVGAKGKVVRRGAVQALVKGYDDTASGAAVAAGSTVCEAADGSLVLATAAGALTIARGIIAVTTKAVSSSAAAALQLVIML